MKRLKDYQAADFFIEHVNLHIELKSQDTLVRSKLVIKRNKKGVGQLILDGENQQLLSIKINEQVLSETAYEVNDTQLTIFTVPEGLMPFSVEITSIIQPQDNTALSGLYRSGTLFCTQCEAQGFRRITYYLDRPDVMALFTTTIVADKTQYPVLLSNGNKIGTGELDGNRHWVTWQDPFKKPAYLFALVAGQLVCVQEDYKTQSGRTVSLEIYVEPPYKTHHCGFAMEALIKAMSWDEQTYGLEYDLDVYMIVAVNDFNMGAMENKGLNIFNAKYILADNDTATDDDFQGVLIVVGHEYFHNWTGNRVTLRDWFQLSLKEGLTVFREQQFTAEYSSEIVSRIKDVRSIRTSQFSEDSGPLAHPVRPESYLEINNFYTSTVYDKGSEVIRMLHTILGPEKFKQGLALYFKRHDGQAVTTDDFVAALSDAGGVDLTHFKRWYYQAGTPHVKAKGSYDAQTRAFHLHLTQHCAPTPDKSPKDPFVIPILTSLLTPQGRPITDTQVLLFDQSSQTFVFDALPSNLSGDPIPSLLGHFSAPVKLEYAYTDAQLAILIAKDPDLFNRWDACGQLFTRLVKQEALEQASQAGMAVLSQALASILTAVLSGDFSDKEFVGELFNFPSFGYLLEQVDSDNKGKINIDILLRARRVVIAQIAQALSPQLLEVYHHAQQDEIGARALKNRSLKLLSEAQASSTVELARSLAQNQYDTAKNMTDRMGALEIIKNSTNSLQRDQVLGHFYKQYQAYPLVVNKWLSLQARSQLPMVLENIQSLTEHPAFSFLNPNKVSALIGGFAAGNPEYFHDDSGLAYDFLADCVIQIDTKNPQVAAHLLDSLTTWKRFAEPQASLMKQALEKIQKVHTHQKLSNDVYEIISKAL